jgi:S1-C subfamily serine protease
MKSTYKITAANSVGTGFVIGKPSGRGDKSLYYVLVTADHLLKSVKGDKITLHLRKKTEDTYQRIEHTVRIRKDGKNLWTKHPEADVAVMYISLPKEADIALLPLTFLATDENLKAYEIRPGDQLFALGFPLAQEANEAGFPILRTGTIASYPILPTTKTKYFLFDFEVYKGNSGGPVFLIAQNRFYKGSTHIGIVRMILGLVSQERAVYEYRKSIYETEQKTHPLKIAVVVHATFIREAIERLPDKPI